MYYKIKSSIDYSNRFGWSSEPDLDIYAVSTADMSKENHMLRSDLDYRPIGSPLLSFSNDNNGTRTERYYIRVPKGTSVEEVERLFQQYIEEQ